MAKVCGKKEKCVLSAMAVSSAVRRRRGNRAVTGTVTVAAAWSVFCAVGELRDQPFFSPFSRPGCSHVGAEVLISGSLGSVSSRGG
jgi:hypothetical protein